MVYGLTKWWADTMLSMQLRACMGKETNGRTHGRTNKMHNAAYKTAA